MRATVLKRVVPLALVVILTLSCVTVQSNSATTRYEGDKLAPGEELRRGDYIKSANREYRLILQRDGNLVLYGPRNQPLWSTNTQGNPVERCIMQTDGNLVLYLPDGRPIWNSNTQSYPGSFLWLQNSGVLVIYSPVWSSGYPQQRREDHHDRRDRDREEDRWRR